MSCEQKKRMNVCLLVTATHQQFFTFIKITGCVCGEGRIPYSHPKKLKAVAVGLPVGIHFKQPSLYKQPELRQVHQTLDKFTFLPLSLPDDVNSSEDMTICSEQEV